MGKKEEEEEEGNKGFIAHSLSKILEDILKGYFPFSIILYFISVKQEKFTKA